jgi:hypothetical protein
MNRDDASQLTPAIHHKADGNRLVKSVARPPKTVWILKLGASRLIAHVQTRASGFFFSPPHINATTEQL